MKELWIAVGNCSRMVGACMMDELSLDGCLVDRLIPDQPHVCMGSLDADHCRHSVYIVLLIIIKDGPK